MFRIQPAVRRVPVSYTRNNLWSDFDKVFDNFFDETPITAKMKVDILDKEDRYVVEAELPGFKKEDIYVSLKEDYLTISVERQVNDEEQTDHYLRRERSMASYKRTFYIEDIDEEGIAASFEDGILSLDLPKKEVVVNEAKKIEIK